MAPTEITHPRVNWKEVFLFVILATAISAPFRLNIIRVQDYVSLPYGLSIFFYVLRALGPIAAYFIISHLFKPNEPRINTLFGKDVVISILSILPIPIGLTLIGIPNSYELQENYFGFLYGAMLVLYAISEEYGWRGYLQQALEPIKLPWRILLIASIWYVWHLNFLVPDVPLKSHLIHFLALIAGSWGLLKITEISHSILFASAVHLSFNIFGDVQGQFQERLFILVFASAVWIILLRMLKKRYT